MTNKEFINYYILMKGKCCLKKNEIDTIYKSKVSIENIYLTLSKRLKKDSVVEEVVWKSCYNMIRLCDRHKIKNSDLSYVLGNILSIYDRNKNEELVKVIAKIDARSPLDIDFRMFKVDMTSSCKLRIDDKKINFKSSKIKGVTQLINKQYNIIAYIAQDKYYRIYDKDSDLRLMIQDIFRFDYDIAFLGRLVHSDIDWIDLILHRDIKVYDYFNVLMTLRLLELSKSINLVKFEELRRTKNNIKDLISTVVKVVDVSDTNKIKFLMKVNEHFRKKEDVELLESVLRKFIGRIRLNLEELTKILLGDWNNIQELIERLRVIDLDRVYMVIEPYNSNKYYVINNKDYYTYVSPDNTSHRTVDRLKGNILVKKDKTLIGVFRNIPRDIDDILLVKEIGGKSKK